MPQLPSGTHVAFSVDRFRAVLESGDFSAHLALRVEVREPEDLLPVINVVLFRPWPDGGDGHDGLAALGEPYCADFMLADIETDKCPWPERDKHFIAEWLMTPRARQWLQHVFDDLRDVGERTRVVLPDDLKGIFD